MSPTARALKDARDLGWTAEKVEHRLRRNVTRDFLGCIDVIALTPLDTIGIQVTSGSNHAARVAKAKAEPRLRVWLSGAHRYFAVWSYSKKGKAGKRKFWERRVEVIRLADLPADAAAPMPQATEAPGK